ncbi:uncharacterized protein LOC113350228 [Papaver somniferum]|uniref:uncharacterized protein LOC113350228 n=1 Tax=Papaver somniferum TaxID=3469 RepID=UPI000E702B72|nr:uncharacterized protein LOC113350228 [Papaver somniferum]
MASGGFPPLLNGSGDAEGYPKGDLNSSLRYGVDSGVSGTPKTVPTPSLSEDTPKFGSITWYGKVLCIGRSLLDQVQVSVFYYTDCQNQLRLAFSRELKVCLDRVIVSPNNLSAWLQRILLPICTLTLFKPRSSSEEKLGNQKRLQVAAIINALSVWKEPNGCFILENKLLQKPVRTGVRKSDSKKQGSANLLACQKKISCGHFAAAIRVLSSSGVAPCNESMHQDLLDKHPHAPLPVVPSDDILVDAVTVDSWAVLGVIKRFPKGTSCGRDGLRAQHLVDVMSGDAAAVADNLLASITGVVNLWLAGKCPGSLGEFIASAPLTPLLKPGGGIRPIFFGTVWRRLVSKVVSFSVGKDMTSYLGDYQFGVGMPSGGSILHAVNYLLEMKGHSDKMSMLLIDFSNAFNMVSRSQLIKEVRLHCPGISRWVEFCYSRPAKLYYNQYILSSALGVHQGDPSVPCCSR